jgi:hypothetical protein
VSDARIPAFRRRAALGLLAGAGLLALALVFTAVGLGSWNARLATAQETELPSVPLDSVGEDFIDPDAPAVPDAPGTPVRPTGPRTIEGPGGLYKVHAGKNDVVQMGEDIVIGRGEHVLGHVFAMGGSVTVRGIVDDDVVAMGGDVILDEGAQVRGDAVSIGGQVRKAPGASILGSSVSVGNLPRGMASIGVLNFVGHGVDVAQKVIGILFSMLIAWVVVSLTRERSQRIAARIEQQPLAMMGWGALGIFAIAPGAVAAALAAVLLVVTIIGIPVAVLVLLGYSLAVVILLFWGSIVGATALGGWLVRRLSPRLGVPDLVRNTLVGVVAISAFGLVGSLFSAVGTIVPPAGLLGGLLHVTGWVTCAAAACAGVGAILRTRAGQPSPLPGDPIAPA